MNAHAEIAEVWPRDGRIRLVGDIHGHPDAGAASWWLLLVLRDHEEHRLSYDAVLEGLRFEAAALVDDLAPEGVPAPFKWDLYLTSGDEDEDEEPLRVGRLLDDIQGKKKIMVFPAQQVGGKGEGISVRPFYTIKDNLSIECVAQQSAKSVQATG